MELEFDGVVYYWRGPAPYHFVRVPEPDGALIASVAQGVTYGWGMIPVSVILGRSTWTTSLWPKDGGYIVPLRTAERRAEGIEIDDRVTVRVVIGV